MKNGVYFSNVNETVVLIYNDKGSHVSKDIISRWEKLKDNKYEWAWKVDPLEGDIGEFICNDPYTLEQDYPELLL